VELPLCRRGSYCATKEREGRHLATAQSGPSGDLRGSGRGENVYPIPTGLVRLLAEAAFVQFFARAEGGS